MDEEDEGRIERLNDTLYSRTRYKNPLDKRTPVKELESSDAEEKWQTPELDEILKRERIVPAVHPFMKKVFIFALVFFIAAILVAGFIFTGGANFVSSRNVDINVLGPTSVSAGQALELGISILNANNADLEFANLSVQYPSGSRDPADTTKPLTYTKDDLGVMRAGVEVSRDARVVLLGATGEVKAIKFSVEYKVRGSDATFYKDKIFEVSIGNAPIALTVESPASIISGEDFTTVVSVTLNATNVLKNIVLKAEYPHGFTILDTTPASIANDNIWALGDLSPGGKKTVSIHGRLVGENKEERTFRFYVGVSDGDSASPNLKVGLVSLLNTVSIERPFIGLNVSFNGEEVPIYIAPAARSITTAVRFQNNLPDKLLNPRLEVSLSGPALDKTSVAVRDNGFYDPGNSTIVWNLVNNFGNPELNPGEGGRVSLNFSSLPVPSLAKGSRDIVLNFLITGVPVGAIGRGPVAVSETRAVRISSQVDLSSKALHSLGPFANYGPIPPKVAAETTYTVAFSVVDTQGDLLDARVTARLGPSVSWLAAQNIAGEHISYDLASNSVTWSLGRVAFGTGFSSAAREISFQISLVPSVSQIGTTPILLTSIAFSGRDSVTGEIVTASNPSLTTRLTNDPAFIQGDDIVVK